MNSTLSDGLKASLKRMLERDPSNDFTQLSTFLPSFNNNIRQKWIELKPLSLDAILEKGVDEYSSPLPFNSKNEYMQVKLG